MPRVRFLTSFDWRPKHGVILAYRAGWSGSVTRRCADQAVAQGKAERLAPPKQEKANGSTDDVQE